MVPNGLKHQEEVEIELDAENTNELDLIKNGQGLLYNIEETPPWYLCIFLGAQHTMTIFAMALITPFFLIPENCLGNAAAMKGDIFCTTLFGLGISTFLQSTFGSRLPLVQGIATEYTVSMMPFMDGCNQNPNSSIGSSHLNLATSFNNTADDDSFIWTTIMRKLQGAVIFAGILEFVIGMTGIVGLIRKAITPLVLVPSIVLIGLMLVQPGAQLCSKHWGISMFTVFIAVLFSQYLHQLKITCCVFSKRTFHKKKIQLFKIFPIILALFVSWLFCSILTAAGAFPESPKSGYGYFARTDIRSSFLTSSEWFRYSYPGQWGLPIFSLPVIAAIIPPLISSIIDSFGEYYGCANLCSIPSPPNHAINRGIAAEGIGGIICGFLGFGSNITTVGTNLGLIGITRVASRRVIQVMSIILIGISFSGKIGALFLTIPDPVIGGVLCVGVGMLIGIAFTNLKKVDITEKRNIFILGFSIFMGMMIPNWYQANYKTAKTGNLILDDILKALFTSPMFVGGFLALFLENTIPGKVNDNEFDEINKSSGHVEEISQELNSYDLPFSEKLNSIKLFSYLPICPLFKFHRPCRKKKVIKSQTNGVSHYEISL